MVEEGGKEPGEEKEQELKPLNEKVYVHIYICSDVCILCM